MSFRRLSFPARGRGSRTAHAQRRFGAITLAGSASSLAFPPNFRPPKWPTRKPPRVRSSTSRGGTEGGDRSREDSLKRGVERKENGRWNFVGCVWRGSLVYHFFVISFLVFVDMERRLNHGNNMAFWTISCHLPCRRRFWSTFDEILIVNSHLIPPPPSSFIFCLFYSHFIPLFLN